MKETTSNTKPIWAPLIALIFLLLVAACAPIGAENKVVTISGRVVPEMETDTVQLPEGSRIVIQVQDTGKADAPAVVLGQQIIHEAQSLPVAYEVEVDSADLEKSAQTTVSVRIEDAEGRLLFINDTVHRVSAEAPTLDVAVVSLTNYTPTTSLPSAFDGQVWYWQAFQDSADGEESNDFLVDNSSQYTLELLPDGTYIFKADCNQGSGKYILNDNSLTLEPGIMTLAECGPESLSNRYIALLGDVVTFVFDAEGNLVLNLKLDAGNLIFAPAPEADKILSGTKWTLESILIDGTETTTAIDPEITAQFDEGQINGSSGCNHYFGSYAIDGSKLTISGLGSTLMACDEARNQREAEFVAGLQRVAAYSLTDETLTLLDAEGEPLIKMFASE